MSWATRRWTRSGPASSSTWSDSDRQNTRLSDAQIQQVRITAPHHPLRGQGLPVVRRLVKQGEPQAVVVVPSGSTQLIPLRWTDAGAPPGGLATDSHPPLLSIASLRGLSTM